MTKICERCGAAYEADRYSRRFCGKTCANLTRGAQKVPYRMHRINGNGRLTQEHRVVAARALGRSLKPGEVVHHINGDKRDNRPSNLEVMSQAAHNQLHQGGAA